MRTLAENLQLLVDNKRALKATLEEKGKAPSDNMSEYAALVGEMDNEEQVSYVLETADGGKAFAQLSSENPITLTASENDIRLNTSAITNKGFTEGSKDIPAYHSERGIKVIQANAKVELTRDTYDYTKFQATLALFNTSVADSVQVDRVTVDDSVYTANTTSKLSDLVKDHENGRIDFGINNGTKISLMRFFIMREEA